MPNDGEVRFSKKRRFRYTFLEERKMWHFFVRELKAQNPDALRKRITLWEMYEQEEKTSKKMFGLESHFRKYMLPRINQAAVPKNDLFLLLRFFRAHLTTAQRKELEYMHDCVIECERDGTFLRARNENDAGQLYPTAEQESIIRSLEDSGEAKELRTEEVSETASVVSESVYDIDENSEPEIKEEMEENHPPREQTAKLRNGSGWISKTLLSRPPLPRPSKQRRTVRDTTIVELEQDNVAKGQEQRKHGGKGQQKASVPENSQERELDTTADGLGSGNSSPPLARSTPQPPDTQREKSRSNRRSSALPQLNSPVVQPKIAHQSASHVSTETKRVIELKRHFLNGSNKFLDGKMNLDAFIDPFVGSKFEKAVRSIAWLVEK